MVTYQLPAIQEKVMFGSAKVEIGDDPSTARSLGIIASGNIEITFDETNREFEPANAPKQLVGMATQEATISFTVWDWWLENVENMRHGLDYINVLPGGPTQVMAEEHTVSGFSSFFPLDNKNLNGTLVDNIVVSINGSVINPAGNYLIGLNSQTGSTNVVILDAPTDISVGDVLSIDYEYDQAQGVEWGTGGNSEMIPRYMRLTNTNDRGETIVIEFWKVTFSGGLSFSFKPDNSTEPNDIPVTFTAVVDGTKPRGMQLCKITDNQGRFSP